MKHAPFRLAGCPGWVHTHAYGPARATCCCLALPLQVFPYGTVAVKWLKRERFAKYSDSFHREVSCQGPYHDCKSISAVAQLHQGACTCDTWHACQKLCKIWICSRFVSIQALYALVAVDHASPCRCGMRAAHLACTSLRSATKALRVFSYPQAETLARLNHPNIIRMYGLVMDGPNSESGSEHGSGHGKHTDDSNAIAGIVTEFVRNGSLSQLLRIQAQSGAGRLSLKQRAQIALQAAWGMAYLHSQAPAVIHFDLKVRARC